MDPLTTNNVIYRDSLTLINTYLCIVYLIKSVAIVTKCISGHNDFNKLNNCLRLISAYNKRVVNSMIVLNN